MRPRHCIGCGTGLVTREVDGRPRDVCPACGHVHYLNPVPAAACAVLRGREVLLCRRAIEPYRGAWGLPAGYQEIDETPETAAVREVREETGLLVRLDGLLDVLATRDDPRKTSLLIVYRGEEVSGELLPGSDSDEVGWFALDDLPGRIAFRNDRIVLQRLRTGEPRRW